MLNYLLSYSEHKEAGKVPRNFPGVLEIIPRKDGGEQSYLHKNYREFGENGNEELEYFFKNLLPRIDPSRTKYKNKKNYSERSFDASFTVSDEAFGLLVLDNELEVWNRQFEAKQKDPKAKIHGKEYKKKHVELYQKGPSGWSDEGILLYYQLKDQLREVRKIKRQSTDKYLQKFREEAGAKLPGYSCNQQKVQVNEGEDNCKLKKLLKEREIAYAMGYENETVLFPPAEVNVDGHGPMGV